MRVIVYVEGASDKISMEMLLTPLIEQKRQEGVSIEFFDAPEGDKKKSVLEKVPVRAVNILRNDRDAFVVAMPDLYPKNKGFPHETVSELEQGLHRNFENALRRKAAVSDPRLNRRFKVFCPKYDLESLILASEESLCSRLGVPSLRVTWRIPVEDQDHDHPPKRVVEELFGRYGQRYRDTADAPIILGKVSHQEIAERCPQCFKPFVDFLSGLGERLE